MQKQLIDEWAREVANEEVYYQWLEEYENLHPEYEANVSGAIDRYNDFLKQRQRVPTADAPETVVVSIRPNRWIWALAAATVTAIVYFILLPKSDFWRYQTYRTNFGETQTLKLEDGSTVVLNANSLLKVPRWGFGEKSRDVFLAGEAEFSVKHLPGHQKFVVKTGKRFDVEVLGTEFTVFARARGSKVVLNKGKVQLNVSVGNQTRQMLMKPGDLILLDNENHALRKTTVQPEVHAAWKGHRYIFQQTTLQEIIYLLAENYGIQAEATDKELLGQTLSGTFTAKNADELLELIQGVLDLTITRKDNKVLISQTK